MIVLAGGDLVLPNRIVTGGSLAIDGTLVVAVEPHGRVDPAGATVVDVREHYVVPGFIDVHVHGVEGHDALEGSAAVATVASLLPRFGVTAFCPTSVACPPADLDVLLAAVRDARVSPAAGSARVLPAHVESNFISPEYRGAQPAECLRTPHAASADGDFAGRDILDVIAAHRPDVGIVTIAPEIDGGLDLVSELVGAGYRVSIGHTAATYEQAVDAIEAGASHATHLFNRMPPLTHRAPGAAGAVLAREEVAAELICDGYHVHPAICRMAVATKGPSGVLAITDGTAGSGLPAGRTARLGGQTITVGSQAAFLSDGTLAGSVLTMDRAFRMLVAECGLSIVDAATLCATSPARHLGLTGLGLIAAGATADLAVLDRGFRVVRTFVGGREIYRHPEL